MTAASKEVLERSNRQLSDALRSCTDLLRGRDVTMGVREAEISVLQAEVKRVSENYKLLCVKNEELLELLAHAVEQDGYGMAAPLFHQAKELLRGRGLE